MKIRGGRLLTLWLVCCSATHASSGESPASASTEPAINVWYGLSQRIVGYAQPDFNLLGHVEGTDDLLSLTYTLNGGVPVELNFRPYRRIGTAGDFNADIPLKDLGMGENEVVLDARFLGGVRRQEVVLINRQSGSYPLPLQLNWDQVRDPQLIGQYVDGHWRLDSEGLRIIEPGYDRLFLIGAPDWEDYEVTVPVTIHNVPPETGPLSGGNGVGFVLRFAGHVVGGPRRFPVAQPKWGYQPFGAIGWLRWNQGRPHDPPRKQFYRGDRDASLDHGEFPVETGRIYLIKMDCTTLPDKADGLGATRYRFKIWPSQNPEPPSSDWEEVQVSRDALRRGGVALLAHHVEVTFGDVRIVKR